MEIIEVTTPPVAPVVKEYRLTLTPREAAAIYVAIGEIAPPEYEKRGVRRPVIHDLFKKFEQTNENFFNAFYNYSDV